MEMGKMEIRPLQIGDDEKGFFEVLGQLSVAPAMPKETFHSLLPSSGTLVAVRNDKIVGTGTLWVEKKFSHYYDGKLGTVGHIEDVVVDAAHRKLGIGHQLVESLIERAKSQGCYKIILDCKESNAAFYEKKGFRKNEISMRMDI
jgi:glucosamine-phosphate N-acetyltransferase